MSRPANAKWLRSINVLRFFLLLAATNALTDKTRVDTTDPTVQLEILLAHNWYRQNAVPKPTTDLLDLRWNHKAAATAAKVAQKIASICSLQHSQTSDRTIDGVVCGENLAYRSSSSQVLEKFPWDAAVSMWGDERLIQSWKYNCASDKTFHEWGHYTQVVSERTTSVGCYAQKCKSQPNALVYVCHYCSAGNYAPLARPYAAASIGQKADCGTPRPNFSKKPIRTRIPTVNDLSIGGSKMAELQELPVDASPAKMILPPLQEPDGANSIDTTRFDTQQLIVFKHNFYRRTAVPQPAVPLPDLVWNPDAAASAAKIAQRLVESSCALSSHSTNSERLINNQQCGENLGTLLDTVQNNNVSFFEGDGIERRPWARMITTWADEQNLPSWKFGCANNSGFNQWGHYTQLVSESTTSVGCAAAACNGDSVIFACLYCAIGNHAPYSTPYKPLSVPECAAVTDSPLADAVSPPAILLHNGSFPLAAPADSSPILADAVITSPSTTSIDTETPNVRTVILNTHNQYRREVCPRAQTPLPDVTWDFAASTTAQTIAFRLANSGGCALQHSQASERNNCGENLGFLGGSLLTTGTPWQRVVGLWGNERDKFSYGLSSLSTFSEYGHYTQVVWEKTKSVGCAAAQCGDGGGMQSAVFVCHYCPAGNYPPINRPYVVDPTSPSKNCGTVSNSIVGTAPTTTTTAKPLVMTAPPAKVVDTTIASVTATTAAPQPTTTLSLPRDSLQPISGIDTTDPSTQDFIVNLHNIERQSVTSPQPAAPLAALTWNDELAAAARLVLGNTALMQNFQISCSALSPTFPAIANPIQLAGRICTANAGASSVKQQPWQQVAELWASDKMRFTYGCSDPTKNFDDWGHYTQIVDGMTSELGCAALPCNGGGSPLTAVMFCVYCDSAKSKPDYALNKPYDTSVDASQLPQCGTKLLVDNDLSPLTTTSSTTQPIPTTVAPLALSSIDTYQTPVQSFVLQLHNLIRRTAQPTPQPALPQLTWNTRLTLTLQQTATQISKSYCRPGVTFAPTSSASSTANTCGINVAVVSTNSSSAGSPWEVAVNQWSAGRAQFQLGCSTPQDFNSWGQYTQMLGRNTKTLACAAQICSSDSSSAVMVCGYCGAGNVAGQLNTPYFAARSSQRQCSGNNNVRSAQLQVAAESNGAQLAQLLLAPVDLLTVQNFMMPNITDEVQPDPTTSTTTATPVVVDPVAQLMNAILGTTNIANNVSDAVKTAFEAVMPTTSTPPPNTSYGLRSDSVRGRLSPPLSPTSVELTCPTTSLDNAISPWMALPNYNRCIVFARGPTGRGKFQQCNKVANGSLLHSDSEALRSLIVLLRQKLSNDANSVIYEVSPSISVPVSTLEARAAKRRANTVHQRHRRHTPELSNRGWSVQIHQRSASVGDENATAAKNAKVNNDFRSLLARTARDRKFLDVLLGIDPNIEQRALDNEGRAVIAQDALTSAQNKPLVLSTGGDAVASGHFVSPLVERFLHLQPPDECNFVDNEGFQQNNELACGIYQWTARHGYICQAPLGSNVNL